MHKLDRLTQERGGCQVQPRKNRIEQTYYVEWTARVLMILMPGTATELNRNVVIPPSTLFGMDTMATANVPKTPMIISHPQQEVARFPVRAARQCDDAVVLSKHRHGRYGA